MAIVNNFLCFDLATGGYFIGILGMMLSLPLVALAGYRMLHVNDMIVFTISGGEIFIYSVYFITCITLIVGTKKRDQRIVFPSLLSSFLVVISIIINLVFLNWQYIPFGLYILYSIVCIMSLCQTFRDEKMRQTVQGYRPARTHELA